MANTFETLADMAALSQREMVQVIKQARPTSAKTLDTFRQQNRKKTAGLSGISMPFVRNHGEGGGNYNPPGGSTSFARSTKERFGAMYAGVVFRYFHFDLEAHHLLDMNRGKLPDDYLSKRKRRMDFWTQEKNWAAIGNGSGAVAYTASASGTTLTCLATGGTTRGQSKGVFRLQPSVTGEDPLYYSAIDTSNDTEVARFYVTAKLTATTCTVNFTGGVGSITNLNASGLAITKYKTGWKTEIIGLAGHISNASTGIYQGADRAVEDWLRATQVAGGGVAPTPTLIDSMKSVAQTRGMDPDGRNGLLGHITPENWSILARFGYTAREYFAQSGQADTTYGLPTEYSDGDTVWAKDADYEDSFIDLRHQDDFFEYEQKAFGMEGDRQQWIGSNQVGSTEYYENWTEATNIVYDGGAGEGKQMSGRPNACVYADNIALPSIRQVTYGV